MGLIFSSPRLGRWKKALMKAIDKAASESPFYNHDIYITTNELTNSLKIHGNVYFHRVVYTTRYTEEYARQYFLDKVQGWVNVYCDELGDPPAINGYFRVLGR